MNTPNIGAAQKSLFALVGGYTGNIGRGIEVYNFDLETGKLTYLSRSADIESPSYLCADAGGNFVYAVSEQEQSGEAYAYSFDHETAQLNFINKQAVNGTAACYISVDKARKHLFITNYQSGSLAVLPVNDDGSLLPLKQHIQKTGKSINTERQEGPHVHTAFLAPDEKHLLYTDLGTDEIHCSSYQSTQFLPLSAVSVTSVAPGSGPRHVYFSKDGKYTYVVTELSADVLVFEYNDGHLKHLQTITMLADDFKGEAGGGDIIVSPNGLFLYTSNRGDANEIVSFNINEQTGCLTFLQRKSCEGKSPRNLCIDPTGNYLLVSNQQSDNINVFELNTNTGIIGNNIYQLNTTQPSCVKFII